MQLSPSKLSVLDSCPRCFWLENKANIKRPRGIFPSLPGGMDLILKKFYDRERVKGIDLSDTLAGNKLFQDMAILSKWRNWRSGLSCNVEGIKLVGAIDDVLVNSTSGELSPFDYKTKGSEPKDDGSQYYQTQLDCYDLLFKENGYKTTGTAYLAYFYPKETIAQGGNQIVTFGVKIFPIKCSAESAKEKIREAIRILNGPMPEASPDCEYCRYENQKDNFKNA